MPPKYLLIVSKEHQHPDPPPPDPHPYPAAVLADNPIAYWRLGEASGTSAKDEIGTADGTYVNTPTLGVTGALLGDSNTAVTVTAASSQYITVPDVGIDQGDGPLSWELWFKKAVADQPSFMTLMSKGDTAPILQITTGDVLLWFSKSVASAAHIATPLDTNWHHVVGTKDTSDNWIVYLDGVASTAPDGTPSTADTAAALNIGRSTDADTYWNGSIDEVAVYSTVLSAARVAAHYAAAT